MEIAETIRFAALSIFLYMTALFFVALKRHDNSIADVAWGMGFVLVSWTTLLFFGEFTNRQLIANVLVLIWGVRLSIRIYLRNRGKGEDVRYRRWREEWGRSFIVRSYFQVFMLQGFLMLLNLSPVLFINAGDAAALTILDGFGMLVWLVGFCFEAVSDWQLDRFMRDPGNRGIIMDRGLWRYSRHPNYFGEVVMWWGIYMLALSAPWGWVSIFGPATITLLIVFVSGIPMTEKLMENNPSFAEYRRRTSVFIPWFPKDS
ncbi:MAG: DUF1295 domain-containing protein [Syntrophales bacterium]